MNRLQLLFFVFLLFLSNCSGTTPEYREYIALDGVWQFAIDPAEQGETEQWYLNDLNDTISLPGTMDENKKGYQNTDTTTLHLNRLYKYEGPAWYRKKVVIP